SFELVELELPDYPARLNAARHRRAILRLPDSTYVVIDDLFAADALAEVHWLLPDVGLDSSARAAVLHVAPGAFGGAWGGGPPWSGRWVKGDRQDPHHGWEAPHYRHIAPANSLVLGTTVRGASRLVTALGPAARAVTCADRAVTVDAGARVWT